MYTLEHFLIITNHLTAHNHSQTMRIPLLLLVALCLAQVAQAVLPLPSWCSANGDDTCGVDCAG
jgi:hypothetical protein